MQSTYITSAQMAHQLPDLGGIPEIAFVGRSNCGKSSLLNALLGRNNLARASSTPGRTQMVNFFAVEKGKQKLMLADLPGYGFSAIGKETKHLWQDLVNGYLKRAEIRETLFLLDIRRAKNLGEDDMELLHHLASRPAALTVVLTKADKLSQSESRQVLSAMQKELAILGVQVARVYAVSTLTKKGVSELQQEVMGELFDSVATAAVTTNPKARH